MEILLGVLTYVYCGVREKIRGALEIWVIGDLMEVGTGGYG
jgi:hypothetical protein